MTYSIVGWNFGRKSNHLPERPPTNHRSSAPKGELENKQTY